MIAPKSFDNMKNEIKNTLYYKSKNFHVQRSFKKYGKTYAKCDICQIKNNEQDLILCACCELFYAHYQCEFGYFCPNCREIFNLKL